MGSVGQHMLEMLYTIHWKGIVYQAPTYEEAISRAKRLTAFEYDGVGNRAIIKSHVYDEEEGIAYVIWIDNAAGIMQWVISGTFLIKEK